MNEGGDNNWGCLVFWRSLQPRWTSAESSGIHAFENISVYSGIFLASQLSF